MPFCLHAAPAVLAGFLVVHLANDVATNLALGFLRLNAHGWETNRALAIGIGGGIGWFMWFNLWGLRWRIEKRLIEWTALEQVPPEAARMRELAVLGAKTNVWLSLPMLFFMAVASHYPLLGTWT